MANPYTAYLESKVLACSPLELVHLAYEAAIDTLGEARDHLAGKRLVPRIQAITRVQQIIIQLQASLDFEKGGDLSPKLSSLYTYMLGRLNDGNRLTSDEPFAEVEQLLRTLDEAWKQIAAGDSVAAAATVSGSSPWMISEPAPVYTAAGYL